VNVITHLITKEQYISNPCRVCSTAYWKNTTYKKPDNIQVVHEKDLIVADLEEYHITRYFRLLHNLKNIKPSNLCDGFYFQNVNIETQGESVAELINQCYDDIEVTSEQVVSWTQFKVYCKELWVFIYENNYSSPIGLGIADFDSDIKEGSLEWIQVLPKKRGLGLGQSLVNELLQRLNGKAEFVTVSGEIDNSTNPESIYRKCGFYGDDVWCVIRS